MIQGCTLIGLPLHSEHVGIYFSKTSVHFHWTTQRCIRKTENFIGTALRTTNSIKFCTSLISLEHTKKTRNCLLRTNPTRNVLHVQDSDIGYNRCILIDTDIRNYEGESVNRSQMNTKRQTWYSNLDESFMSRYIHQPTLIHLSHRFTSASKPAVKKSVDCCFGHFRTVISETFATKLWTSFRDRHFPP
jgi:hypothetical protein